MGRHAFDAKVPEFVNILYSGKLSAIDSKPVHTRIDSNMDPQFVPRRVERFRMRAIRQELRKVIFVQARRVTRMSVPQHEDLSAQAAFSQADAFFRGRYGERVNACVPQLSGDRIGAMPVRLRLDDCHQPAAPAHKSAQSCGIIYERA
jgi:hypothetical protein